MLVKHDFNQTIITLISRNTMRRSQSNHKLRLSIQSAGLARHEYQPAVFGLFSQLAEK